MPVFAKYKPDLPDFNSDGLVTCRNVYPFKGGYKPFYGLSAATGALPAAWVGGGAFQGPSGNNAMLGATAAALYSHASGAWTSKLVVATSSPWFFTQFGDRVICANGSAPVKYTLSTGLAANLPGSPPSASYCATVKDFVFLAGNSSAAATVYNSAINDAEGWTVGLNQADATEVPDSGPIIGLSGGDFGLVFTASSIDIFEYVGTPIIFTRRRITDTIGCLSHGSIGRNNRRHYFLSARGFYYYEDGQTVPIGENVVDQTFLNAYTLSQIRASMRCTVDPKRNLVMWSMPDRLWIYNWSIDAWSVVDITGLVGISTGLTASATLESIAATFPSIEDVTPNLDDTFWNGDGQPLMLLIKTDFIGYTFSSGITLEATWKSAKQERFRGHAQHIRKAILDSDTVAATLNIDCSQRLGDSQTRFTSAVVQPNGDVPIRARGRFTQEEWIIPAGATWTYAQGYDVDAVQGGRQ